MGDKTTGVEALTQRQKEILRLISHHLQAKEVARLLNISERTVKTHTEEARKRLGVATSRDAARLLADHEIALGRGDRWPAGPIAASPGDLPVSAHEQALYPERTLHADALERSGERLAHAGLAGQAGSRRGNPDGDTGPEPQRPGRQGGVHDDRGNRLVDRRFPVSDGRLGPGLARRLASLNAFQWLGLIVLVGVLSAVLVSGLIAACLGTLEGLQVLNRQIR